MEEAPHNYSSVLKMHVALSYQSNDVHCWAYAIHEARQTYRSFATHIYRDLTQIFALVGIDTASSGIRAPLKKCLAPSDNASANDEPRPLLLDDSLG